MARARQAQMKKEWVIRWHMEGRRKLRHFKRRRITISRLIQGETSDQWAVYEQVQAWADNAPPNANS